MSSFERWTEQFVGVPTDTPTQSYFVESGQARKARSGLDALGISYTESSWQPGIREFVVDASDPAKLRRVFG